MTKKKDDGGSADQSMTLRDYFAAKAMQGVVANLDEAFSPEEFDGMARIFYSMADAMLEARKQ